MVPLEPGDFICTYAGEVLTDQDAETRCGAAGSGLRRDAYLFNLTTPAQCRRFGAVPLWELLGLEGEGPATVDVRDDEPFFVVDAFTRGNVGRFVNHACGPSPEANVTAMFVFTDDSPDDLRHPTSFDARLPHIALFSNRRVEPGEELRYDYDLRPPEGGADAGTLACRCHSSVCRGWIY